MTYLIFALLSLVLTVSFIKEALIANGVNDMRNHLQSQAKIVVDEVMLDFNRLDISSTKNYMHEMIKKYSLDLDARILIFNFNGIVKLDSHDKFEGRYFGKLSVVSSALIGKSASEIYQIKDIGERIMYVTSPVYVDDELAGAILIASSADYIFEKTEDIINRIFVLSIIVIFILSIVGFVFADFFAKPLEKMTEAVRAIARGEYDKRIDARGHDEFANLGNAYNMMLSQLEQVDKRRKQFVSNVSHELRTPMASMKIISETLLSKPHWSEDVYRDFFIDVDTEITRLNEIIDSLLYLVDIEKKELQLEYSLMQLNDIIEGVIHKLKPLADRKNIKIYFDFQKKIKIQIDKGKIQQCIINIIGNAIKYTSDGGEIFISLFEQKSYAVIKIRDTGHGIPKEELPYIFDRFHRVDKARARATGGWGLGLSIAQQIVHLHQGSIKAESVLDEGTTMSIFLPLKLGI